MQRSTERILTTHTGSQPRPDALLPFLEGHYAGRAANARIRTAVQEAVDEHVAAGIDVVSDGEMGKPGLAHFVADRLTGYQGAAGACPFAPRDLTDYPGAGRRRFVVAGEERPRPPLPTNDGPSTYVVGERLAEDLENLASAVAGQSTAEGCLPAISPGCVAFLMRTT